MKNLLIIIPVFNQLFYTRQVVDSIKKEKERSKETDNLYLCIVNNASTDNTLQYLEEEYTSSLEEQEKVKLFTLYINSSKNLGYGGGVNLGIDEFHSSLEGKTGSSIDILVMNNDMLLLSGCLDSLIDTCYSREDIGVVGGRLLFPDGVIQHGGAFLNSFGWGQHIGAGQRDELYDDRVKEMEYVTGALFYIKGNVCREVGKFDERFERGYFEEVDFCYRARRKGYKTFYTPHARAVHYENVTSKSIEGDQERVKKNISDKNQIKFYLKRDEEKEKVVQDVKEKESEHKLLITSQIYGEWSFTMVMRNLAKGLKRNGVDVSIAPVEYHYDKVNMVDWEVKEMINKPNDYWNRVVMRSCEGDHMYLMPPGKQRIAHTTGESTRVNHDWKEQLNNVDKVLTTSSFFRNVMSENGVKKPIFVLPNSVNLDYYKREGEKLHIPSGNLRGLNFISVFHFGERKAPDILVRAFSKAFTSKDDVSLTLHALSMKHILQQQNKDIDSWIKEITDSKTDRAPILVTSSYLEDRLMPNFLRNFDVFVLPTRGEGFGLPFIEAGALGIPSIATGYSGLLDYVGEDNGWLIDHDLVDIPLQYLPYFQNYIGGKWAEPNEDHLIELFRQVYNNREEIKKKGQCAYEKSQRYSIESIGKLGKSLIFDE